MDPLSDVLSLLRPTAYTSGGFDVGGTWNVRFPPKPGLKCYAVLTGDCQLSVEDVPTVDLHAGDCFVLPSGKSLYLGNDLSRPPIDASAFYASARNGTIVTHQGGGACFILGAHFLVDEHYATVLTGVLPPVIHLSDQQERATLRWSLERMQEELLQQRAGSALISQQLAYMMLVQALRLHLENSTVNAGWISALRDRQLSLAVSAMHRDPSRRWTLQSLAEASGMSRTAFAMKFKFVVGSSAMEYLTRWRMLLAAERLKQLMQPVSEIGYALGYESESAFTKAFRRVMNTSPREFRKAARKSEVPSF